MICSGDENASVLVDELKEILSGRNLLHDITEIKISTDAECIAFVYLVANEVDSSHSIVQTLKEFCNASVVTVGFSAIKGSPIVKYV